MTRSAAQLKILSMDERALMSKFEWLKDVEFADSTAKVGDFYPKSGEGKMAQYQTGERGLPAHCYIQGTRTEDTKTEKKGDIYRAVIGAPDGRIILSSLATKFTMIDTGKAFGKDFTIHFEDEEKDKLYAIHRLAELDKQGG